MSIPFMRLLILIALAALSGCDEEPAFEQTALADLPAKPDWGPTVPQVADAGGVFGSAPAATLPFRGTLLCRVAASREEQWDRAVLPNRARFNAPDLLISASFPGDFSMNLTAPPNRYVAHFSVPNLRLERDQGIQLVVDDDDVSVDDRVGSLEVSVGDFPLRAATEKVSIECRGVPASEARTRAAGNFTAVDRELGAMESSGPSDENMLQGALASAAGWVGWSHADVVSRQLRYASARAHSQARARDEWQQTLEGLPPAGEAHELSAASVVQLVATECSSRCNVRIRVEYRFGSGRPIEMEAIDANQNATPGTERGGVYEDGRQFAAGSWLSTPVVVVHEFDFAATSPVAWRVRDPESGSTTLLRPLSSP